MRILHGGGNTLLPHRTSKHVMKTRKGPVNPAPASDNSRPSTRLATTSIPRREDVMSIRFVTNAAVETTKSIKATVQHKTPQTQLQKSSRTVVETIAHRNHDIYPFQPSWYTSTQPAVYLQPASDYPKGKKHRSSGLRYSKEQDFFILHCRLVKNMDWKQVEDEFKERFGYRSKNSLNTHFASIRCKWGLSKGGIGSENREKDKNTVLNRSSHLPKKFLTDIGFVH